MDFLFVTGWSPTPGFNYAARLRACRPRFWRWILFGERILNLGPVARSVLIEHLKELLIVVDGRGQVIDTNTAAARVLGVPPEKLIGSIRGRCPLPTGRRFCPCSGRVRWRIARSRLGSHARMPGECSIYPIRKKGTPQAQLVAFAQCDGAQTDRGKVSAGRWRRPNPATRPKAPSSR